MPKINEFYHVKYKKDGALTRRKRLRCASDTKIFGTLAHFKDNNTANWL